MDDIQVSQEVRDEVLNAIVTAAGDPQATFENVQARMTALFESAPTNAHKAEIVAAWEQVNAMATQMNYATALAAAARAWAEESTRQRDAAVYELTDLQSALAEGDTSHPTVAVAYQRFRDIFHEDDEDGPCLACQLMENVPLINHEEASIFVESLLYGGINDYDLTPDAMDQLADELSRMVRDFVATYATLTASDMPEAEMAGDS